MLQRFVRPCQCRLSNFLRPTLVHFLNNGHLGLIEGEQYVLNIKDSGGPNVTLIR